VTVVASSILSLEALQAVDHVAAQGVACDLIDLRSIRPLDWDAIESSVRKTGRLLVLDPGHETGGVAGEIVARITTRCWGHLRAPPSRLAMPDAPESTSPALTLGDHVRAEHIAEAIGDLVGTPLEVGSLSARPHPHDVPGNDFQGPF
jgi:pyruvate dehydrogenase E1 component beta subunit